MQIEQLQHEYERVQADLARSYGVSQATISRLSGDRPFEAGAAAVQ